MKNIALIIIIMCLYGKLKAADYETKKIGDMACVRIDAVAPMMGQDSLVWLCVKQIQGMPPIDSNCKGSSFMFELKDTNHNGGNNYPSGNEYLEGSDCDSQRNNAFYIYLKIAEQSNIINLKTN